MDSNKFKIKEEKYFTHTEVVAAAAQMNCYTNVGIKKRKSLMESGAGCPDDENDYDENDDDYDDDFDDLNSSYNSISKLNEANMSKKLKNNSKQPKHDSEQLSKRLVADKNDDSNSESRQQKSELICIVCGSPANGYNFDAVTCESCKAFFRRNAFRSIVSVSSFTSYSVIGIIYKNFDLIFVTATHQ